MHALWPFGLVVCTAAGAVPPLDADSCAALRGQGSKFSLSLAACPDAAPAAAVPRRLSPATQAQHLLLFERASHTDHGIDAPLPWPTATPDSAAPAAQVKPRPVRRPPPRPAALTRALQIAPTVEHVAAVHAIDPLLLHAIARVESRHDPAAVSHAGARGLMQVMPATASRFGVVAAAALHDVPTNLDVSARYLQLLSRRFDGRLPLVLAAYNAGEGAVERHGRRIPPYAETQAYVRMVLAEYTRLKAFAAEAAR